MFYNFILNCAILYPKSDFSGKKKGIVVTKILAFERKTKGYRENDIIKSFMANHRLQNKEFCQRLIAEQTIASVIAIRASSIAATLGLQLFAKFHKFYFS
ncbi:hypothetical protein [Fibrobacter succinogenes]|uniref:hypothetical protein n=1 Tax=Fibrobacter succinogenes TaxID=833 RepID=UPI001567D8B9|nr:hypothetical protein [Fibrobacter succinogenes]